MAKKKFSDKILTLKLDREKIPTCMGAFAPYDGFAVLFAIFEFKGRINDYKPCEYVHDAEKEVGRPILGLAFKNRLDWDNFVNIVNHYDEKIKKGEIEKCQFGDDSEERESGSSTSVQSATGKSARIAEKKVKAQDAHARGTRGKR